MRLRFAETAIAAANGAQQEMGSKIRRRKNLKNVNLDDGSIAVSDERRPLHLSFPASFLFCRPGFALAVEFSETPPTSTKG